MKFGKKLLSVSLAALMLASTFVFPTVSAAETKLPFRDLVRNWYREAITYSYENGLMDGTSKTTFEPDGKMTRGMFVTVLGRLCNAEEKVTSAFSDVKKSKWYAGYVGWAVENKVTTGFEDGTFRPDENISRQDAATMLCRYLESDGVLLDFVDELPGDYKDDKKIGSWASDSVEKLSFYGIFKGDDKGKFNPKETLSRAEGATMFMRLHRTLTEAKTASDTVSAYDIMNTPESFYSNFDSTLDTQGELATLRLTPHKYYSAPWYVGMNLRESDVTSGALEYVKICYKSDKTKAPTMKVESPVYTSEELSPLTTESNNGYTTAIFELGDSIRSHREAYFTAKQPIKSTDSYALRNLDLRLLYNTYLRVAVYPFADDVEEAELLYIAYFANESDARAYDVKAAASYIKTGVDEYPTADIRDISKADAAKYTDELKARGDEILNTESAITPDDVTGTVYYISSLNGDDKNDGLSPETALRTPEGLYKRLNSSIAIPKLKEGDGVFFERGGVYNATDNTANGGGWPFITNGSGFRTMMIETSNVVVGAYGEGAKPMLTNCVDINGSKNWEATQWDNVWKLSEPMAGYNGTLDYHDIGNIVVYDKEGNVGFGVKIAPNLPADPYAEGSVTPNLGFASNGFETFIVESVECRDPSVIKHNLEFFHDYTDGSVYIYCDKGNPADVYDKLILVKSGDIFGVDMGVHDVIIDNITVAYGATGGIYTAEAKNITVQNCTFEWIGGRGGSSSSGRLGNGFQNWGSLDNVTVDNCLFYQIYDGACSTQISWGQISYVNGFYITDCVFVDSNSPVEIWNLAYEERTANVTVSGNYFMNENVEKRFGAQRETYYGGSVPYTYSSFIALSTLDALDNQRFIIENNVFDMNSSKVYDGRQYIFRGDSNGVITRNNIMIGGVEGASDVFMTLSDVDWRDGFGPENAYDCRTLFYSYNTEIINKWTTLGMDRGSIFYFVK